jgi:hypothetical protein
MSKAARKPHVGATVLVTTEDYTYTGIVLEVLDSQFLYKVTHVNNQPSPCSRMHSWEKFCFFTDVWKLKPTAIDHHSSRY